MPYWMKAQVWVFYSNYGFKLREHFVAKFVCGYSQIYKVFWKGIMTVCVCVCVLK